MIVHVENQDKSIAIDWDCDLSTAPGIARFITQLKTLGIPTKGSAYQISLEPALNADNIDQLFEAIKEQRLTVSFQFSESALASDQPFVNQCIDGLVTHNQRSESYKGIDSWAPSQQTKKKRKPAKKSTEKPGIQMQVQQAMAVQQEQQTEQQQQQEQQQEQALMQNYQARQSERQKRAQAYADQVNEFSKENPDNGVYYYVWGDGISINLSRPSGMTPEDREKERKESEERIKTVTHASALIRNALGMFNFKTGDLQERRSSDFIDALSESAVLKLKDYSAHILDGLDFNHLPDGFYVKDLPVDPDLGQGRARVLFYDERFKRKIETDDYPESLRLQFKTQPEVVINFNPLALCEEALSLENLKAYELRVKAAYDTVKSTPTISNFSAWLAVSVPENDHMKAFVKMQTDNPLFNDSQVRLLIKIIEAHGIHGLKQFWRDYSRLKDAGKEEFLTNITTKNFLDISDVSCVEFGLAVNRYLEFSKEEKIWFEHLYQQHTASLMFPGFAHNKQSSQFDPMYNMLDMKKQAGVDFADMVATFSDFLAQMKKIDATLVLPQRCPIVWANKDTEGVPADATQATVPYSGFNMRVALSRFLSLLDHVRSPQEQLRVTGNIDLSHSGDYYAVVHEGLNIVDSNLGCQGQSTVEKEGGTFKFPVDGEHIYKISLKDLVEKTQACLRTGKATEQEINEFEKLCLRYIANQAQRKDIAFYKRIFEKIRNSSVLSDSKCSNTVISMMYIMTLCTTQAEYEGEKFQSEQVLERNLDKMLEEFSKPDSVFRKTGGRIVNRFIMQSVLNVSNQKQKAMIDTFNLDDLVEALSFQTERFRKKNQNTFVDGFEIVDPDDINRIISAHFAKEVGNFEKIFDVLGKDILYACIRNANHTKITLETIEESEKAHCSHISFFTDTMILIVNSDLQKDYQTQLIQVLACLDNSGAELDDRGNPVLERNELFVYVRNQLQDIKGKENEHELNQVLQRKLKILLSINSEKTKPAITVKEASEWLEACKATSETDIHLNFKQKFPGVRFGKEYNDSMQDAFESEYNRVLDEIIEHATHMSLGEISIPLLDLEECRKKLLSKLKECKKNGYDKLLEVINEYTTGLIGGALTLVKPFDEKKYQNMCQEIRSEILDLYNRPLEMHARELIAELGLEQYEESLIAYQLRYVKKVSFDDKELDKKIEENSKNREEIQGLLGVIASIKNEKLKKFLIESLADTKSELSPMVVKELIKIFNDRKKTQFHLEKNFVCILEKSDEEVRGITQSFEKIFDLYPEYSLLSQDKLINWILNNPGTELVDFMETVLARDHIPYQKKALNTFFLQFLAAVAEADRAPVKEMLSAYTKILKNHPKINFADLFSLIQGLKEKDPGNLSKLLLQLSEENVKIDFVLHCLKKKGNSITDVLSLIKKLKDLDKNLEEELKTLLPVPTISAFLKMIDNKQVDDAYQRDPYGLHSKISAQISKEDKDHFFEGQVRSIVKHGLGTEGHISKREERELLANYRYLTQIAVSHHIAWPGLPDHECFVQEMKTDELRAVAIALRKALKTSGLSEKAKLKIKLQYLAVIREAYYRATGYFPYSTQMLSVLLNMLNQNKYLFEQIQTGEGKGMIAALQAGWFQAQGYAVDVFSSDFDQLSRRDQAETAEFFALLGVKSTLLASDSEKEAYLGGNDETEEEPGIHYTTASNVSLYKAARMLETGKSTALSKKTACVCDESDTTVTQKMTNVLSDNIDGADPYSNPYEFLYNHLLDFVENTEMDHELEDFRQFMSKKNLSKKEIELFLKTSDRQLEVWLNSATFVFTLEENKDFQIQSIQRELATEVKEISVAVILEEGTKKPLPANAQWGKGVHQLLHLRLNREAKRAGNTSKPPFPVDAESRSITSETNAQVLERYQTVLGISGSVRGSSEEQQELFERYTAHVFDLPTHNPSQKKMHPPKYFAHQKPYMSALVQSIKKSRKHESQPILILCEDFLDVQALQKKLASDPRLQGYAIQIVGDEKDADELEAKKIRAGQDGIITIATPRFGRGTDIKPTNVYGLKVIETYVATTRDSIQNQGRPARNGKPGEFQRIIDLETHAKKKRQDLSAMSKKELAEYIDKYRLNAEVADINYRKFNYQAYDVMNHYLEYLDSQNFDTGDWKKMRAEIVASCADIWDQEKEACIEKQSLQTFSEEVHCAVAQVFEKFKKEFKLEKKEVKSIEMKQATALAESDKKEKTASYEAYHNNPELLHCYFEDEKPTDAALKAQSTLFFEAAQQALRNMSHLGYFERLRFRYALHREFSRLRRSKKKNGYTSMQSPGSSEMIALFDCILRHCQHHIDLNKINDVLLESLLKPIVDFRQFFESLGGSKEDLEALDIKQQAFVTHLCESCSAVKSLPLMAKLSALNPMGMPGIDDDKLYKKFEQELLHSMPGLQAVLNSQVITLTGDSSGNWDRLIQALAEHKNNLEQPLQKNKNTFSVLYGFLHNVAKENEKVAQYIEMATQFKKNVLPQIKRPLAAAPDRPRA